MNKLSTSNCIHSLVSIVTNNYFKIWKYCLIYLVVLGAVYSLNVLLMLIIPGELIATLTMIFIACLLMLAPGMIIAFSHTMLSIARSEPASLKRSLQVGYSQEMWWQAIIFVLLYTAGIMGGMLLLIIPGIYLSISWYSAVYYLCDKSGGPIDCLRKSRQAVKEAGFFRVFAYIVLMTLIVLALYMPFYFIPGFEYFGIIISLLLSPVSVMTPIALYLSISKPEQIDSE